MQKKERVEKEHRKKLQMADSPKRILEQTKEIWMVKVADQITNLQPPPGYWTRDKIGRYREEAVEIYEALKEGSRYLSDRLKEKITGTLSHQRRYRSGYRGSAKSGKARND